MAITVYFHFGPLISYTHVRTYTRNSKGRAAPACQVSKWHRTVMSGHKIRVQFGGQIVRQQVKLHEWSAVELLLVQFSQNVLSINVIALSVFVGVAGFYLGGGGKTTACSPTNGRSPLPPRKKKNVI